MFREHAIETEPIMSSRDKMPGKQNRNG